MTDTITILRPGQEPEFRALDDLPAQPGLDVIRRIVLPELGLGANLERVRVLVDGKALDMFVDEMGHMKRLPLNEIATTHYRRASLTRCPDTDPEDLPAVVGPAVLFSRPVWF